MPDITMCRSNTCSLANTCYRNSKSGTKEDEYRQSYFYLLPYEGEECNQYWPIKGETE
jgi:hypothetical protein